MITSITKIKPVCEKLHKANKKVVLVTGFFDLLHEEHLRFLQKARAVGDVLIVGLESDNRARLIKGEGRPIETQSARAKTLTPYADHIILLPEEFATPSAHRKLVLAVAPEVLAVSSHTAHQREKRNLVREVGGELLVVHPHNPSVSTTKTITKNQL